MSDRAIFQKLNMIDGKLYLSLLKPHRVKFTNHRKIPSSKYSGRFIIFWEDTSTPLGNHVSAPLRNHVLTDVVLNDEEIEPP